MPDADVLMWKKNSAIKAKDVHSAIAHFHKRLDKKLNNNKFETHNTHRHTMMKQCNRHLIETPFFDVLHDKY